MFLVVALWNQLPSRVSRPQQGGSWCCPSILLYPCIKTAPLLSLRMTLTFVVVYTVIEFVSNGEMDAYLKVSVANHIGEIVLNRPNKMNIMDDAFFNFFHEAARKVANDPTVRAILIYAEGPAFTAGLDLKSAGSILSPGSSI
jgi:hypothetical protein